jgi:hypothetical protein
MSLFSYAQQGSPADNARELVLDYIQLMHDALSWRADSLRTMAASLDALRDDLEHGMDNVCAELARGVLEHHPEESDQLGADDHGQGA